MGLYLEGFGKESLEQFGTTGSLGFFAPREINYDESMCQTQVMVIPRDQVMQVCYSSIPFDLYADSSSWKKGSACCW